MVAALSFLAYASGFLKTNTGNPQREQGDIYMTCQRGVKTIISSDGRRSLQP